MRREQPVEYGLGGASVDRFEALTGKNIAAKLVRYRQGITVLGITQSELAFVVHAANIIGRLGLSQPFPMRRYLLSEPPSLDQTMAPEQLTNGTGGRKGDAWLMRSEPG